jgi:hypothetical protein
LNKARAGARVLIFQTLSESPLSERMTFTPYPGQESAEQEAMEHDDE